MPTPRVAGWAAVVEAFLLEKNGKSSTRASYRRELERWAAWCATHGADPLTAGRQHAAGFVDELERQDRAPSTIKGARAAINGAYQWALDEGVVERNPFVRVRGPKVDRDSPRRAVERDEFDLIKDVARAAGTLEYALVMLLYLLGDRVSAICNADLKDLKRVDGIRVLEVTVKGAKKEHHPLAPPIAAAIDAHVGRRATGPLLLNRRGRRLTRQTAWRIVRKLGEDAGIPPPGIHPHMFRHGFGTLARKQGIDLGVVQDAMSHANPATTLTYDHSRRNLEAHPTWTLITLFDFDDPANATQPELCRVDEESAANRPSDEVEKPEAAQNNTSVRPGDIDSAP